MACFTTVLCQCRIVQLIHSNAVKMYLTVKITSIGYSSTHYTLHNVAQTTLPWYTTDYGNLQLQIILERSRTCINISLWSSPAPWYALKAEFWISQRKLYMNTCVHLYNSIQPTNHWMHVLWGEGRVCYYIPPPSQLQPRNEHIPIFLFILWNLHIDAVRIPLHSEFGLFTQVNGEGRVHFYVCIRFLMGFC